MKRATTPAQRLLRAMEMMREAIEADLENLRRRHPNATDAEIDELYDAEIRARPADAPGRPITWEEFLARQRSRRAHGKH